MQHQCTDYSCDRCESSFETLTALARHLFPILSIEIEERTLREELYARVQERDRRGILKSLKDKYNVPKNQVEERLHLRDERYVCHLCQAVFPDRLGLKEHFWSHARKVYSVE